MAERSLSVNVRQARVTLSELTSLIKERDEYRGLLETASKELQAAVDGGNHAVLEEYAQDAVDAFTAALRR